MARLALILPAVIGWLAVTWLAGLRAGFLVLLGLGFGAALSAARFGFTTGWRNLITNRDPWGMIGQMVLMALCAVLSFPLLVNHPDEISGALAPITWSLLLGSLLFGFAMQLADGCGSGTLYKAGAASPTSWVVMPTFIAGSFFGASHQAQWVALGGPLSSSDPIDLIEIAGPGFALIGTVIACAVIGIVSFMVARHQSVRRDLKLPKISVRWLWGALALALLYALHLVIAGQPWGIVYGLGLWGAKVATLFGTDLSADSFWGLAPHAQRLSEPILWDVTSLTNIGLLYGAMMASHWNNPGFQLKAWPKPNQLVISVLAGLVMGYSSRMAYGCNVGAYLGGIASGSLHGWVWFLMAFIGSIGGVRLRQKAGIA